jgi:hypothetical protein
MVVSLTAPPDLVLPLALSRANAVLVSKFHVPLHVSHAALQILTFQNFAII